MFRHQCQFRPYSVFMMMIVCSINLSAQQEPVQTTNLTKLNILTPGITREQKIGGNQTLHFSALANIIVSTVISSDYNHTDVYADPAIEAGYRYYFNLAKRAEAGKRTEKNSGNYVSAYSQLIYTKMPVSSSYFEESKRRPIGVIGTCWGMQRNYKGHFSLDLSLGVQYRIGKSTYPDINNVILEKTGGQFLPAVGLTLGFWLD